jgi:non-canonical purine NTP pyrophosphatase (RdgB/HAM1 family)
MKDVVLATLNPGKIREMTDILRPFGVNPLSLIDLPAIDAPPESGVTFLENAAIKASYYSIATSLPCVADDSGLEVDVLEGAPGIYSSRFAGEEASDDENVIRLIEVLGDKPRPWNARFVCSAAYAEERVSCRGKKQDQPQEESHRGAHQAIEGDENYMILIVMRNKKSPESKVHSP